MLNLNQELEHNHKLLACYLQRWREYPLAFAIEALQSHKYFYPNHHQAEIYEAIRLHPQVAIASYHGLGKSTTLSTEVWRHLICFRPREHETCKVPVLSPTEDQTSDVIWSEIGKLKDMLLPVLSREFIKTKSGIEHFELGDKWFASPRAVANKRSASLQGYHGNNRPVIDEAAGIDDDEVFEVAMAALTEETDSILLASNPLRLKGFFYKLFKNKKKEFKLLQFDGYDNLASKDYSYIYIDPLGKEQIITRKGMLSERFFANMKSLYGENSGNYAKRVRGQFPKSDTDQIVLQEWVDKAWNREPSQPAACDPRIMGVDVAWSGVDKSSIVVRTGSLIEELERWQGNDPTVSSEIVVAMYHDLKNSGRLVDAICIDALGLGAGTASNVQHALSDECDVYAVIVARKAPLRSETRCHLVRDYLWFKCRQFFQYQSVRLLRHDQIAEDLFTQVTWPSYTDNMRGEWIAESKDDIKKREKQSPDLADALNLTFYVDYEKFIEKKEKQKWWLLRNKAQQQLAEKQFMLV